MELDAHSRIGQRVVRSYFAIKGANDFSGGLLEGRTSQNYVPRKLKIVHIDATDEVSRGDITRCVVDPNQALPEPGLFAVVLYDGDQGERLFLRTRNANGEHFLEAPRASAVAFQDGAVDRVGKPITVVHLRVSQQPFWGIVPRRDVVLTMDKADFIFLYQQKPESVSPLRGTVVSFRTRRPMDSVVTKLQAGP